MELRLMDVEKLQQELSPDFPCGEDLEYDPEFGELERSAVGKEEQQIGDTVVDAVEPEWKTVKKLALSLLNRTKDLRVISHLMRASLSIDGIVGFRNCLALIRNLLENQWSSIHPVLDEDDGDPTMRVNALLALSDEKSMLRPLRLASLVRSRAFGSYNYRDLAIAAGELTANDNESPADSATINAAVMDADVDDLQATANAVILSLEHVKAIDSLLTEQLGASNAPNFAELNQLLVNISHLMNARLADIGISSVTIDSDNVDSGVGVSVAPQHSGNVTALSGQVASREDVTRTLDKIIEYYNKNEPASPIPILMIRAKKLVSMGFIDIIKNMAPDGLRDIETIRGPEDDDDD
jgi:type VI secretion system protein ImpA